MRWIWVAAAIVVATGCGGRTPLDVFGDEPSPSSGGSASEPAAGTTVGSGGGASVDMQRPAPPEAKELCGKPGDLVATPTAESLEAQLIRVWLYCTGPNLYGIQHEGIEFAADGHWFFLHIDQAGNLARGRGFDGEGTWVLNASNAGAHQIDLQLTNGFNYIFPAFQKDPVAMRINWMGGTADYVAVSSLH